jgi:HK97 family phage major capsid protein
MAKLQEILRDIREKDAELSGIFDGAGDADLSSDDRGRVKSLSQELETLSAQAAELKQENEFRVKHQQRQAQAREQSPVEGLIQQGGEMLRQAKAKSIGDRFLGDEALSAYLKSMMPTNGNLPKGMRIHSPAVEFGGFKDLLTGLSSTSAGALVRTDYQTDIDAGVLRRPLVIRDLISTRSTDSDTVSYVRRSTSTNNAAPVAEATATSGSSGVKPESAFTLLEVTETVKTIAHWIPATRRALSDASQIRGMINDELIYGLDEELEDQILNGVGTGENFTGVATVSGTGTQAWSSNMIETLRKARTKVMTEGRARPTAYVLNPIDWESLDLLQDNEARYDVGGPMVMGTPRLWGLPVVESEAQPVGFGWVAAWNLAVLWDRQRATILMSDSHSDFFIRNLIAILAELRAAFGILRPAAFIEADLTA